MISGALFFKSYRKVIFLKINHFECRVNKNVCKYFFDSFFISGKFTQLKKIPKLVHFQLFFLDIFLIWFSLLLSHIRTLRNQFVQVFRIIPVFSPATPNFFPFTFNKKMANFTFSFKFLAQKCCFFRYFHHSARVKKMSDHTRTRTTEKAMRRFRNFRNTFRRNNANVVLLIK